MNIQDIFNLFGKEKILKWFIEIPYFYFSPTTFFNRFFKKSEEEKLTITFFYTTLIIGILYLFSHESVKELLKAMIIEIAILIGAFFILSSTKYILPKRSNPDLTYFDLFYFLCTSKLLSIPLQIVFLGLYEKFESYEFLFIHFAIQSLLLIFTFIFSNKIFYKKIKYIILGSILNILIFNIIIIIPLLLKFDKYCSDIKNPIFVDNIYEEFEAKIEKIDSITVNYPFSKIVYQTDSIFDIVYCVSPDDADKVILNLPERLDEGYRFKYDVLERISKNKFNIDSLKYKRNKELYKRLDEYIVVLKEEFKNPIRRDRTSLYKNFIIQSDSQKTYLTGKILSVDTNVFNRYVDYLKFRNNFYKSSNIAEYPLVCYSLFTFPANFVLSKIETIPN